MTQNSQIDAKLEQICVIERVSIFVSLSYSIYKDCYTKMLVGSFKRMKFETEIGYNEAFS